MARIFKPKGEQSFFASARGRVNEQEIVDRRIKNVARLKRTTTYQTDEAEHPSPVSTA